MNYNDLPTDLLLGIVDELATDDNVIAIALGGSFVRGDATAYSDVDLACLIHERDPDGEHHRYSFVAGRLVGVSLMDYVGYRRAMSERPQSAIWLIPVMRELRVLYDPDGQLATLKHLAVDFDWQTLQPAADQFASYQLHEGCEMAMKLLGGLLAGNEASLLRAVANMVGRLTDAVAVQRGLMIVSGNGYYPQVQVAGGLDTSWTRNHYLAAGYDQSGHLVTTRMRAVAALDLWCETVRLLDEAIQPRHRAVIAETLRLVTEAGY